MTQHVRDSQPLGGTYQFDGITFNVDPRRETGPILDNFIIDSGAAVTVTDNRELITDMHLFEDLILADSGGKQHFSKGCGTINVGGHTIVCYWAPTLRVSVISVDDLTQLGAYTIFTPLDGVYMTDHKSRTMKWIGNARGPARIVIRFVGLQNKPDRYNPEWIHRLYGHASENVVREICRSQNINFTSQDGYELHQRKYITGLLQRFEQHMTADKQRVPIDDYDRSQEAPMLDGSDKTAYQELLGCYNWLAGISRPDMAYAVSKFGSFTQDAKPVDLKRLRRTLM